MADLHDPGRRTFLKLVGGASCAAGAALVGVPVASAFLSPLGTDSVIGASGYLPTISPDAVPADGSPVSVAIVVPRPRDAWAVMPPTEVGTVFLRRDGGQIVAMSTICPHLGCRVDADPINQRFRCPCHDSDFGLDGSVIRGPSPRGLDRLETRLTNGVIEVEYVRFKTGTASRERA